MKYSPNSSKGGIIWGSIIGFIQADTRRLDYSSYDAQAHLHGASRSSSWVWASGQSSPNYGSNRGLRLGLREGWGLGFRVEG